MNKKNSLKPLLVIVLPITIILITLILMYANLRISIPPPSEQFIESELDSITADSLK